MGRTINKKKTQIKGSDTHISGKSSKIKGSDTKIEGTDQPVEGAEPKTLERMSNAELRLLAREYGIPHGGKQAYNKALVRNIRKHMKEHQIDPQTTFINTESGSITAVSREDEKYTVSIIDQDAQPHKKVSVESMGAGAYTIKQETLLGKKEETTVLISDSAPDYGKVKKPKTDIKLDKDSSRNFVQTNKLIGYNKQFLYPDLQKEEIPTSTSASKKEQEKWLEDSWKKHQEYKKLGLIPFYYPNDTYKVVDPKKFNDLQYYQIVAEKKELLSKEEQKEKKFFISTGNKINTQVLNGRWVGVYFQRDSGVKASNPISKLAKAQEIRVDNNDIGHVIAFNYNLYGWNDPFRKNVRIVGLEGLQSPDPFKVSRAYSKSILDSLATRQNNAVRDSIRNIISPNALKYRNLDGVTSDVKISEQKLQIARAVMDRRAKIHVRTVERDFTFYHTIEDFKEKTPVLYFEAIETTPKPLDTDTLLKVIVKKFRIEPDSAQATLEQLHNTGWITYPRKDQMDASLEPIRLQEGKKLEDFTGTIQEHEILRIVNEADIYYKKGEQFIQLGQWILQSGDLILKSPTDEGKEKGQIETRLATEPEKYNHEDFDIMVLKDNVTPDELLAFLITHNIGTPATRTTQLSELKQAGIITLKEGGYQLDQRGFFFVAGLNVLEENDLKSAIQLQEELRQVKETDNYIEEFKNIVNKYKFLDQSYLTEEISKEGKRLLEAEQDLAYLEKF